MFLAGIYIETATVLAPLAGWTDSVFRRICKEFGVGLLFTEMASADAIVRDRERTMDMVRFSPVERPIAVQLFGAEADILARAAEIISGLQPDFIDINFGCPAKKVVRRGGGAALLRDLDLIEAIGRATTAATDIPVTAKLRSGWQESVVVEACQRLQHAGIKAVTIHPRSQKMGFQGQADWQQIAAVKNAVSIPVIGNGDVTCARDAERMLRQTGCDLVMVGRAARGNPWIFAQINAYLRDGSILPPPTFEERLALCIHHLEEQERNYGARTAVYTMRKHIACYLKSGDHVSDFRRRIFAKDNIEEVKTELRAYLNETQQAAVIA